jgi:hypothetical protein
MTPKERAQSLLSEYLNISEIKNSKHSNSLAKHCALIAVSELIKTTGSRYWYDVKAEIEKL